MFLIPPKLPYSAGIYEELFGFGNALKLKDGVVLKEKKTEKGKVIFSLYELELNVKYVTEQDIIIQRISDSKISVKKRVPPIVPSKSEQRKEQTHETNGVLIREIRSQDSSPSEGEGMSATFTVTRSNPITIPSSMSFHASNMKKIRSLNSVESGSETETQRSEVSHVESDSLSGTIASSMGSPLPSFEEIGFSTGGLSALKGTTSPPFVAIGINALGEGSSSSNKDTPSSLDSFFSTAPMIVDIATPHIPGEKMELVIEDVILVKPSSSKNSTGILYITNYQLIFVAFGEQDKPEPAPSALSTLSTLAFTQTQNASTPQSLTKSSNGNGNGNANTPNSARHDIEAPLPTHMNDRYQIELMVPLTTIAKFDKVDRQNSTFMFGGENSYSIDVTFKDFRRPMRFLLTPQKHSRRDICNYLAKTVFPQTIGDVFAVSSKCPDPADNGWKLYNVEQEFGRLGVIDTADNLNTSDSADTSDDLVKWCYIDINDNYSLCESYPRKLVVPERVSAKDLMEVANFRSKGRIPVLVWRNKETGVSMSRCSQPKTGMSRTYRNKSDEKMLRNVQRTNPNSRVLHIMDARPMANAFANMALGGGYENLSYYPDCELEFMGVANIHVVRDSYNKLRDLCEQATLSFDDTYKTTNSASNVSMLVTLETTHWLDHLSSIISASSRVVHLMDVKKESILIHCSDGWDRTSQVCALAQLLLDPYYRTISGFLILLEKSWLQFGHKFGDRLGLNFEDNAYKDAERSPIFLQFIDATWQIMSQFPQAFEFTEDMLICIMEHVYSGRFGTFLFNTEKEREAAKLAEISPSLWTYILKHSAMMLNPFYSISSPSVLYPAVDILSMKLWKQYYFKHLITDVCAPCKIDWTTKCGRNPYVALGRQLRTRIDSLEEEHNKLKEEYEDMKKKMQELQEQSAKQQLQLQRIDSTHSSDGNFIPKNSVSLDHHMLKGSILPDLEGTSRSHNIYPGHEVAVETSGGFVPPPRRRSVRDLDDWEVLPERGQGTLLFDEDDDDRFPQRSKHVQRVV